MNSEQQLSRQAVPAYPVSPDSAADAVEQFRTLGGVHLRGVVTPELAKRVTARARDGFVSGRFASHPYEASSRTGFSAPGTELVRGELVTLRETYDYHPLAPVFVPELHLLHDELTRLVGEVIGWIDRTTEGNRGKKLAELRQGQNVLRVAHQLESCAPDRVSFRDHYDFGLFTAFLGGADGLEGNLSGQWVKIDLAPGDVFVGAGTVLTKFLPRLRPFHHRVVGGETGRLSAFLFFDPHEDEALPGGGTFGEFLAGKMEAVRVAD